ncbi:hypothetical protein ABPG72_011816 [Tetrahymena utriculariae]
MKSPVDDYDIDLDKLNKLEKMIVRVDADIHKMQLDNDKTKIVETLKKTHDIYSLILGELHFQLTEMKLESFGSIIQKIFLGENTLLNSLLKVKTNLEYNPKKMIEDLDQLGNRVRRRNSSTQVAEAKKDEKFIQQANEIVMQNKKKAKDRFKHTTDFEIPKVFADKGTDTALDREDAKNLNNVLKKNEELDEIRKEFDESSKEIENFLKNKNLINFNDERSKAESSLKHMLKDLSHKKRKAEQIEREGQSLLQFDPYQQMQNKAKQNANAALIFGTPPGHILRDGKLIAITSIEIQTDKDPNLDKIAKMTQEMQNKQTKFTELEKKVKEIQKDADIYKEQCKKLNDKISELNGLAKKKEEDQKKEKKEREKLIVMDEKGKERFRSIVEENYRLKLKLKELVDEIKLLEKENKGALEKFKQFIMNSNLTDEQKRMLIGKVEELFTLDLSKRLNIRELEHLSKIDNDMLKDPLIRAIIGDPVAMVKKIKQDEKDKQKLRANPNYDPDFDPNLLEDGQRIITRKVKKKIRRLNSKGQWVEEEIEVEEECVVDKFGNVIRSREKPKEGFSMDPLMQNFINKHGGLAIGGAKFNLPQKPNKPLAKNGQPIKEGEWFIDQNGNRVKMTKNQKGEEEYEIQEEYIDEFGNKKIRNKKMIISKDKDGNEIITEEYIDPKTGKKITVQKKVFRDKDGNEVIEEITTDANGNKITKRTKVLRDKDGNEIIEEEIIDQFGNKIIVRKKKMKDANGNDIWVTETINADGSRTIVTEKIGKNGERIIIEEKIDKNGKKTITEKKITIGKDGKPIIEETIIDEKGNRIVKTIKQEVDAFGNVVTTEEAVDENGNKIIKKTKMIVDKDGNQVKVEEIIDANGNKITKYTKQIVDKDGNIITVEETVDEYGNKITKKIKRMFDKDGNEIIEEEIIDANGNRIIIRTKKNKDGSVEEERYNPETGERIIVKKRIDANGREIIEETRIDKNGKSVTTTKVISTDKFGNKIIEESYIDPETGQRVTVRKKVTKDKNGNDVVEETIIDENGNVKTVKKRVFKDKDGRDVIEEEITDADGKKYKIRTKVYKDADGNEIIEEERIDEFGNRVIVRRKKDKDGREIVEEIRIDANGNKTVIHKVINKDGTIEETIIDAKGNITKTKRKQGTEDKEIQVNSIFGANSVVSTQDLQRILVNLGCTEDDARMIVDAIMNYIHKGTPFILGENMDDYAKLKNAQNKHNDNLKELKEQRKREMEEIRKKREEERVAKLKEIQAQKDARKRKQEEENDEDLDVIDDKMNEDEQAEALFKKLKNQKSMMGELLRNIRNQLGLNGDQEITLEQFKEYMEKYKQVHSKCGENCPHLKRFYAKLGFIQNKYKRKFLKMKDTKINAFQGKNSSKEKLPKIMSNSKGLSDSGKSFSSSFYKNAQMNQTNIVYKTQGSQLSPSNNMYTNENETVTEQDSIKGDFDLKKNVKENQQFQDDKPEYDQDEYEDEDEQNDDIDDNENDENDNDDDLGMINEKVKI